MTRRPAGSLSVTGVSGERRVDRRVEVDDLAVREDGDDVGVDLALSLQERQRGLLHGVGHCGPRRLARTRARGGRILSEERPTPSGGEVKPGGLPADLPEFRAACGGFVVDGAGVRAASGGFERGRAAFLGDLCGFPESNAARGGLDS